jgi:hypothetical protein
VFGFTKGVRVADPVTIGLIALQTAGPLMEGIGANAEARSEARALERNAGEVGTQGAEDALFSLREARMQAGADLAGSAAGGVGAGNGTLADLMRANAEARWQQAFNIQQSAAKEAEGLRMQARAARNRGKFALMGGVVRAGAAALGGYGDARNQDRLAGANNRRREQERRGPVPMGSIPLPRHSRGNY